MNAVLATWLVPSAALRPTQLRPAQLWPATQLRLAQPRCAHIIASDIEEQYMHELETLASQLSGDGGVFDEVSRTLTDTALPSVAQTTSVITKQADAEELVRLRLRIKEAEELLREAQRQLASQAAPSAPAAPAPDLEAEVEQLRAALAAAQLAREQDVQRTAAFWIERLRHERAQASPLPQDSAAAPAAAPAKAATAAPVVPPTTPPPAATTVATTVATTESASAAAEDEEEAQTGLAVLLALAAAAAVYVSSPPWLVELMPPPTSTVNSAAPAAKVLSK